MKMGRVVGRMVCQVKYPGLDGVPLLWVQPMDRNGKDKGQALVACDATKCAGLGEIVMFEGGREAAMALDETYVPVDHSIIMIIDGHRISPEDEVPS